MASVYPDPLVVRLARENRAALFAREDLQVARMAKQWLQIERSLQSDMLLLSQQIIEAKNSGSAITEQLISRMDRYKVLNASLKQQVLTYTKDKAVKDITAEQLAYAEHGLNGAVANIKSQFNFGISFNTLSVDQVTDLSGLLGDGTPLNRLLKEAYPESLDGIVKALLEGSARGLGIKQIAEDMAKRMGMGLERITLIARTEQLRAWRIATQRQYQESGVVLWHERLCARDARTCVSCLMLDGEKIPIDKVLDDHPRGRCTSIPIVKGAPPIIRETGQEWFERQSPALQKEMLGPGMYDLWKKEKFDLRSIATKNYNPIWGSSPRVRTLAEMKSIEKAAFSRLEFIHNGYLRDMMNEMKSAPLSSVFENEAVFWKDGRIQRLSKELENNLSKLLRIQDPRALKGLQGINIVSDKEKWLSAVTQDGKLPLPKGIKASDVKGFYRFNSKQIWILSEDGKTVNAFNFTHELGHHAQNMSRHPEYWNKIYNGDKSFDRHTSYGGTKDIEGFAETFAAWVAEGRTDDWESFSVLMEVLEEIP